MLETPHLVHTLMESIQTFLRKKNCWFDLNFYLYLMVWLEIGRFAYTYARDLKLSTHFGRVNWNIFWKKIFLVWLELVHLLNGLTLNWTFTYSRTISALGLVLHCKHCLHSELSQEQKILAMSLKLWDLVSLLLLLLFFILSSVYWSLLTLSSL